MYYHFGVKMYSLASGTLFYTRSIQHLSSRRRPGSLVCLNCQALAGLSHTTPIYTRSDCCSAKHKGVLRHVKEGLGMCQGE